MVLWVPGFWPDVANGKKHVCTKKREGLRVLRWERVKHPTRNREGETSNQKSRSKTWHCFISVHYSLIVNQQICDNLCQQFCLPSTCHGHVVWESHRRTQNSDLFVLCPLILGISSPRQDRNLVPGWYRLQFPHNFQVSICCLLKIMCPNL